MGQNHQITGHEDGTLLARARPFGETRKVSHCPSVPKSGTGQLFDGTGHVGLKAATSHPVAGWMQVAAMNLIADDKAGKAVDPERLKAARAVLDPPPAPRARVWSAA